jgi:heparan-alpha-glucosaminide N-acetyltransferase
MSEQPKKAPLARLASLDAYRGFIMLVMASAGFGFAKVAQHFPDSHLWQSLGYEFEHVSWSGCSFWDLIQPSFMFMVGVAIPFSYAGRVAKGQSRLRIGSHVVYRAIILILLGIFLSSGGRGQTVTNFTFVNVLTQIGLGYAFVYLLRGRSLWFQLAVLVTILAGYWYLFFQYPVEVAGPGAQFSEGLYGHWNKNANFASDIDVLFLNLFPRSLHKPFTFNEGGYQTLNFIPSMATMILGLMAGELLLSARASWTKFRLLFTAGALCLLAGLALDPHFINSNWPGLCPIVKRIWTPSWAVYSSGWTFWMLAGFYLIIDVFGYRRWAFPFIVVGMNSIAIYCMFQLWSGWIARTLKIHFDWGYQWLGTKIPSDSAWHSILQTDFGPDLFGGIYGPIVQSVAVLAVLWLICLWMYRRGIFLKV